jgi:hypothetical protein
MSMLLPFFTLVMLTALAISLLTGKAYYRRVIEKDEETAAYWMVVASYLILGLLWPFLWVIEQFS